MKPNKSNFIYEAVSNYRNEVNAAYNIIKEALKNPAFAEVKSKYKNVLEVQLNEAFFPAAPSLRRLSVGPGLAGPTTAALNAVGRLEDLLKVIDPTINEVGAREVAMLNKAINDAIYALEFERDQDVERLNAQLAKAPTKEDSNMIVDEINSVERSVETVKQNAKVALSKAYFRLRELLDFFAAKKSEIDSVISSVMATSTDLSKAYRTNVRAAEAKIKAAETRKEKQLRDIELEDKTQELERKIKKGGIGSVLRGLFREEKQKIHEGLMSDLLNPGNGKLDKYTSKVDAFIDEAIETCDELVEEGNSMLEEDFYRLPQAGERSRLILEMIGLIKKFKCDLENIPWQLRQRMG